MSAAFSNGFEWDCWSENWCQKCSLYGDCGILGEAFVEGTTPTEWTPGTDDLRDRYHCSEFVQDVQSPMQRFRDLTAASEGNDQHQAKQ